MITSPSNQHIALLRSLHVAKGRRQEGLLLLEGPHLIEAALTAQLTPQLIVYDPESLGRTAAGRQLIGVIEGARQDGAEVYEAAAAAIERASETRTPQGVVAAVPSADVAAERVQARRRGRFRPLLLVLDAISDPGNLGTILRSALAADVDEVVLAPGCADPFGPKVMRAGSGAHFHLPVREAADWRDVAAVVSGAPPAQQVLLAEADARQAYDELDLTWRTALIIGNEAHGPSSEARRLATSTLRIPMWNKVESLNAAIAASVILFEGARQRRERESRSRPQWHEPEQREREHQQT
jgi:TrmH family RNA methyltransferase